MNLSISPSRLMYLDLVREVEDLFYAEPISSTRAI